MGDIESAIETDWQNLSLGHFELIAEVRRMNGKTDTGRKEIHHVITRPLGIFLPGLERITGRHRLGILQRIALNETKERACPAVRKDECLQADLNGARRAVNSSR